MFTYSFFEIILWKIYESLNDGLFTIEKIVPDVNNAILIEFINDSVNDQRSVWINKQIFFSLLNIIFFS